MPLEMMNSFCHKNIVASHESFIGADCVLATASPMRAAPAGAADIAAVGVMRRHRCTVESGSLNEFARRDSPSNLRIIWMRRAHPCPRLSRSLFHGIFRSIRIRQ
jgi:hypothetical protein